MTRYEPEHLERWTRPECYIGAQWPEYFVFLGQHRDSDSLARSNFECALKEIGGETETVTVARASHFLVGWVECSLIHEDDAEALRKADEITAALEDYPVVDEMHWSELEWNEAADYWESLSVRDRAELIKEYTSDSIFAARRAELPQDDTGALLDYLRG